MSRPFSPLPTNETSLKSKLDEALKGSNDNPTVTQSQDTSSSRGLFIVLTLAIFGITVYLLFQVWKRNRHRPIPTLYNLNNSYSYSRLNQNEIDNDCGGSLLIRDDLLDESHTELEIIPNDHGKPATIHVETDSLINISNSMPRTITSHSAPKDSSPPLLLEDVSDEDLLH